MRPPSVKKDNKKKKNTFFVVGGGFASSLQMNICRKKEAEEIIEKKFLRQSLMNEFINNMGITQGIYNQSNLACSS